MSNPEYKRQVQKGDIIFQEGDIGDCAFLIEKGTVEIYIEETGVKTPISILGIGDIFGEMAIIDRAERGASARAMTNCELLVVSKEQLVERVEDADPVVKLLVTLLMDRVRSSLRQAHKEGTLPSFNLKKARTSTIIKHKNGEEDEDTKVLRKIRMEKELHQALHENKFYLNFQPIYSVDKEHFVGMEALIRWKSPTQGNVSPDLFMGIAEETSLIVPLGQWVVKRSIYEFAKILEKLKILYGKKPKLFLSINVSGRQLRDKNFFSIIKKSCKDTNVRHDQIKLEITERVLLKGAFVIDWINKSRELGFKVALDDFGTGYSSLSYLSRLDVNSIKIDKSFTQKLSKEKNTIVIVKSLIQMAKGLGMSVIAEGIEDIHELQSLKNLGCHYAQGYYFSKPMTGKELINSFTQAEKAKQKIKKTKKAA